MNMNLQLQQSQFITRRHFLKRCQVGLGSMALGSLMGGVSTASSAGPVKSKHFGKAKSVIYLHMAGSPPQLDLFDYKPMLNEFNNKPCPKEFIEGRRLPFFKGHPTLLGSPHKFKQYGQNGQWISNMYPKLPQLADDVTFVKSMYTDQFNHAPAQMMLYTGTSRNGSASIGSWITYGLGSANADLPGFVVMVSGGTDPSGGKSLWGSGFLPSVFQGVQCRSTGDPILYVSDPKGMSRDVRRRSLDAIKKLNEQEYREIGDPETLTRIEQYELAYRMQISVPEVMDINRESKSTLESYGAEPGKASFANNCLLARRLVEQGVRYVQLFDWGWDFHGTGSSNDLVQRLPSKCAENDKSVTALLMDLKQRGLLDETLVIWGGEFGRTSMNEKRNGSKFLGRDHHPDCFTIWLAGAGIQSGITYGETDELGYTFVKNSVHLNDLQATILHLAGLDPYALSYRYQGLDQRLIGVGSPKIIDGILS